MTTTYAPTPERCWDLAHNDTLRLNNLTKINALIFAACEASMDTGWLSPDRFITVRRLMGAHTRPEDFGGLIAAVVEGHEPVIRARAERLVNLS